MIRPAFIFVSTVTILFLTGCESDQEQKPHPAHHQFGYTGDNQTVVGPGAGDTGTTTPSTGDTTPESTGPIAPPPPPPPPPSTPDQNVGPATTGTNGAPGTAKHDYPYAQPVPGKPGFVTSPYAPYSGYVDVRGFPPGTEVKDPYTQKVFLVP
jgi:hypothetical protein